MSGNVDIGCEIPFNEEGVDEVLSSIADEPSRNLVRLAVATARMRFLRPEGISESEFQKRLPLSPFDMTFFASVVKELFSKERIIERIRRGESLSGASDWDV
jgi:hypothetical protein